MPQNRDTPQAQPNAPAATPTVPLAPHVVPLHRRTNVWKWQAKDKNGSIVQSSPGLNYFISRGPTTKPDMVQAANLILNNHRLDAIRAGLEDPGYELVEDSVQPAGDNQSDVGDWRPEGAVPTQLPISEAVQEHHQRLIDGEE